MGRNGVFGTTSRRFNPNSKRLPPELSGADIYAIESPTSLHAGGGGAGEGGFGGMEGNIGSDSRFHDHGGGQRQRQHQQPIYRSSLTRFRHKGEQHHQQHQQGMTTTGMTTTTTTTTTTGDGFMHEATNSSSNNNNVDRPQRVEAAEWAERRPPPGSYVPEVSPTVSIKY